jgi:hypothetical protein
MALGDMDALWDEPGVVPTLAQHMELEAVALVAPAHPGAGRVRSLSATAASEGSFPARIGALLRSRPITDAVSAASRQDWPEDTYDMATFALAAIDLVISRQGFEDEATWDSVVEGLAVLAQRAAPDRPSVEHRAAAAFAVNALLNRSDREAPFTYRFGDYTDAESGFQQRQVSFRLLEEHEDPTRGDVILRATSDAINALVGGLEFDVEDEQVANEVMLERQLARGAFDAAEASADRARALSVKFSNDLAQIVKDTRRDLRAVSDRWQQDVPERLANAREHIQGRLTAEHRLLTKVRDSLETEDPDVALAAARIASRLVECQRRHEGLHSQVIHARAVFLDEQDRQVFRPPSLAYLPDLNREVLGPLLLVDTATATSVGERFVSDVSGPVVPRVPRLYRVVNDLWALSDPGDHAHHTETFEQIGDPDPVTITAQVITAAQRAVTAVGFPTRLSALVNAALTDPATEDDATRHAAACVSALAALWCYAPEDTDVGTTVSVDLAATILGPRTAVDSDGLALGLPGWVGDDLIIAATTDALQTATPSPVTCLQWSA